MKKKKKLLEKDKKIVEFVKRGGRTGAKKDFESLLKEVAKPLRKLKSSKS